MGAAVQTRVLHELPGRVRLHLPAWNTAQPEVERYFRRLPGVRRVQANPRTGNVLVQFVSAETDTSRILEAARHFRAASHDGPAIGLAEDGPGRFSDSASAASQPQSDSPPVFMQRARQRDRQRGQGYSRAHIAVRGLDRDPRLAPLVVERLEQYPAVRARANPLTGRVLVEFAEDAVTLSELIATVADVERGPLAGEERPAYPLDPGPLAQSVTRLAAAVIGLTIIAVRQARGDARVGAPPRIVALVSIAQGIPALRRALAFVLGRNAAELLVALPHIALQTLVGNPLSLAIQIGASVRLLTEVRSRRAVWRRFEEGLHTTARALPGDVLRVESGERSPHVATVVEGTGTATGVDGLPRAIGPSDSIAAGERLVGGPFLLDLEAEPAFIPAPRPDAASPTLMDRYLELVPSAALSAASAAGLASRSVDRALATMLLVNARPALLGRRQANIGVAARALRAGVVVVGTRPDRVVRRPDVLLLASPRLLTDGTELVDVWSAYHTLERDDVVTLVASVATAVGAPWGNELQMKDAPAARDGSFRRGVAQASLDGQRYSLRAARPTDPLPATLRRRHAGEYILVLRRVGVRQPLGALVLRPRLAAGVAELVAECAEATIQLAVRCRGDPTASRRVAERAGIELITSADGDDNNDDVAVIRRMQRGGRHVAFASDSACASAAFAACDLAIGVADRRQQFAARADLIVSDVRGIAAIIDSARRHEVAARDSVALSALSNVAGAVRALRRVVPMAGAGRLVELATVATLGAMWIRLRGGERPQSALAVAADPRPERWGRRSREEALRLLDASEDGLTMEQAATRRRILGASTAVRRTFFTAIVGQLDSPLTVVWGGGTILSLILGAGADALLVAGTLGINVLVGAWQEHRTEHVADALKQLERGASARVLRDGRQVVVAASELVPGDVLLLAGDDRIAADARILGVSGLEVDEATLTGEPFPVVKHADGGSERQHVVLEGSHVTSGSGRAVVVAVGAETRLGATAAALDLEDQRRNVLGARLAELLRQSFPVAGAGGATIAGIGLLRGAPLLAQLALGTSVVLAAVPEGLPLLTGLGQAATARRLAREHAIVRRLAAVETLGRVDTACVDKTGTLTRGQLAVRLVASLSHEAVLTGSADSAGSAPSATPPVGAPILDESLRDILRAAALASPHPDVWNVASHPTDIAVIRGAERAGLREAIRARRERESPFDPTRAFHAATVGGSVYVKGALEALLDRCITVRSDGVDRPLDDATREEVATLGRRLAERGLRVLLVAVGSAGESPGDPRDLTALGFVALSDPLREDVPAVVQRCHEAGVRVIMLTGDHPVTAQTIAREAGLFNGGGGLLTGTEMAELDDVALIARLETATVIARATPLDKLRIVESLQRRGHVVAMTGDGVNDAPALRLADVGVAMGQAGTEVARQAADIVLLDDDFATLVTALVEGRAFWRNTRRALGVLLGGNLGELGLILGASVFGEAGPLTIRQILAVNLLTDLLPAVALAVQGAPKRRLAELSREGAASLDAPLRRTIGRRAVATALPSLATYLLTGGAGSGEARSAGFAAVVTTQLAQTLVTGTSDQRIAPSVAAAVGVSAALVIGGFALPGVRSLVGLTPLSSLGWALVTGSTLAAPLLHRLLATGVPIGASAHRAREVSRLTPAVVHG